MASWNRSPRRWPSFSIPWSSSEALIMPSTCSSLWSVLAWVVQYTSAIMKLRWSLNTRHYIVCVAAGPRIICSTSTGNSSRPTDYHQGTRPGTPGKEEDYLWCKVILQCSSVPCFFLSFFPFSSPYFQPGLVYRPIKKNLSDSITFNSHSLPNVQ